MFKNKLNNYFLIEIIKSYFLILISLSLLIWIAQSAKFLNLITDSGLSTKIYIQFILLIFPKTLAQLMILSFLISLFFSIIRLQESKELEIYWLSGISKEKIIFLILKISFFITFLTLIIYLYLVPITNYKAREILINSEFSVINSLVKKKNFNSPLKNLTLFVSKNDNQGNIEKIYIFEDSKTIIAKKGRVINVKNKNYLEIIDGFIHEKNKTGFIKVVKFEKTLFDFTKYQTNIIKHPKFSERSTESLINSYMRPTYKNERSNALQELHKRFFKPLFIPIISLLCCFLLYENKDKINLTKLKILTFSFSTIFIIFIEILISLSIENNYYRIFFYLAPFVLPFVIYNILNKFLKTETIN